MAADLHARAHAEKLESVVRDNLREKEAAVDDRGRIVVRTRLMPPDDPYLLLGGLSGEGT